MTRSPRKPAGIYARLYVSMLRKPKHVELSDLAWRLYVSGILWCRDEGNDGHVPSAALVACVPGKSRTRLGNAARELSESGLFIENGNGWHIHDYGEHQDTADKIAINSELKRSAARARWQEEPEP